MLTQRSTSHKHLLTHAGMAELVDAADSKSAGCKSLRVRVSLSVPCAYSRVYSYIIRYFCEPFFAFKHHLGTTWVQVLIMCPTFCPTLFLIPLSSIPTKDAAAAASFPHAADERSEGEAWAIRPLFSPFPLLQYSDEKSKGLSHPAHNLPTPHRFFQRVEPTGVVIGTLRLRLGFGEKTENLKIVQFPRLLQKKCPVPRNSEQRSSGCKVLHIEPVKHFSDHTVVINSTNAFCHCVKQLDESHGAIPSGRLEVAA